VIDTGQTIPLTQITREALASGYKVLEELLKRLSTSVDAVCDCRVKQQMRTKQAITLTLKTMETAGHTNL